MAMMWDELAKSEKDEEAELKKIFYSFGPLMAKAHNSDIERVVQEDEEECQEEVEEGQKECPEEVEEDKEVRQEEME